MDVKAHWENVYTTKKLSEVSWYQPAPQTSLGFIAELGIHKNAAIIDVGGGDSLLADHLLKLGYEDLTVLDISNEAITRAKKRLGKDADKINWVVSDILEFTSDKKYDCWHDRAAFHFLTTSKQVKAYLEIAEKHIEEKGKMVIGTFSTTGPEKCSGLPVKQYSEQTLSSILKKWFDKIKCITTDHITPTHKIQHFLFCSFKKINPQ